MRAGQFQTWTRLGRLTGSLMALLACLTIILAAPAAVFADTASSETCYQAAEADCCHDGMMAGVSHMMAGEMRPADQPAHCAENECGAMIGCVSGLVAIPSDRLATARPLMDRHSGPPQTGLRRFPQPDLPEEPPRV